MRRIMIRTICGITFVTLVAAGIASIKSGAGLTTVLQAQTASESQAAARSGFSARRLHCTNGTIQGRFAARTDGVLVGVGPFAAVGAMTFDGFGTLTNTATTSTNGNIASGVVTGTYSVNDDCTGQMAIPSVSAPPTAAPLTFNLVIADRGDEIAFIATRAPAALSGTGKRID